MAKSITKDQTKGKQAKAAFPLESRSTVFLTVGWMLAVVTALMLEISCISLSAFARDYRGLVILARYLFYAAFVIGTISLILGFVSSKLRKTQPPRGFQTFAYVVGGLPLALVVLDMIARKFF